LMIKNLLECNHGKDASIGSPRLPAAHHPAG
jgi:hypothetical protein